MKITTGIYRGIKLDTIQEKTTRPTIDRAKQGIFNAIQFQIKDKVVIDFFAGSGALAIEAISRGANFAYLIELNTHAAKCIQNNLNKLQDFNNYKLINNDYKWALNNFINEKNSEIFDIVFLDPPYQITHAIEEIVNAIFKNNLLSKQGIIIIETNIDSDLSFLDKFKQLSIKKYKYGKIIMLMCKLN